ncbi:pyridoxal phosphate-dependent decarboxylase family protein [Larsenimonas suaedae]|uniref:Aminotransferase class I/II-fold pyridoxal phosphate-dependent enzyme n=1 Tax=Larsenimonas suaedae TaxID=1851019 RepID=A0ABU1GT26_9GAMM|nr:aminotransferase class I/II-fold pyridoxal phosphate-dependent enzyme [Larsenimonas suaedae]MCM2972467.1 aminotransferase class I/II-fold pyridoxal phosphate-dependent enzyme [Larsenimonas suaedae]MDR5894737.1 aminotransferase class I/II-fold pyridoxal phosphate-dependent enzyme [Larsenimonas suaedae]
MTIETRSLPILERAVNTLAEGYKHLPEFEPQFDAAAIQEVLIQAAERMWDNYPYPHPMYAGQMLKPPHPVARLAYMMATWINPNNHALDGGKASSAMEKEAVEEIARMFGWSDHLGHLTGGGTLANLEALWVANQLHPGKTIVASQQAHYTHSRICGVLQIPFEAVAVDDRARMDVSALEEKLKEGNIGTVVVTLGTTGVGSVDPLPAILELKARYGFRIHIDSAYGGYYALVKSLPEYVVNAYAAIKAADSIVIDPHKHGLQPYGCGCVLFKDPEVGRFYKHDSPYTYFSSSELHLGEISLECSRAGASAVALWSTMRLFPLVEDGEFANGLASCRNAAVELHRRLSADARFVTPLEPDLDIVIWAPKARTTSAMSERSEATFKAAEERHLYLATFSFPSRLIKLCYPEIEVDTEYTTCVRSALMKPEHSDWLARIWDVLDQVENDLSMR